MYDNRQALPKQAMQNSVEHEHEFELEAEVDEAEIDSAGIKRLQPMHSMVQHH
jgi:hypothetical protein